MNDIKNDINLSEAVSRREQQLPPMPDGLNERLMQQLQEKRIGDGTSETAGIAPKSPNRRIRLYTAIAASILLIIGLGTVIMMEPTQADTMVAENNAQPLPSHQGNCEEGAIGERSDGGAKPGCLKGGVGSLTSTPSKSFAENCHEKGLQTPPRPSATPTSFGGRQRGAGAAARTSAIDNRRGAVARSIAKHELPDTLGNGIWQSERNVVLAIQMLGECEAVIEKSEQEMRNTIVKATFNATPQPANAVLVTNEAGDCEIIETKSIIEI